MHRFLFLRLPLFEGADGGSGGAGGGNDAGGQGGGWAAPDGLPADFLGASADETLGKLLGGYNDLNTRFGGLREKLSKMPAAPAAPDQYAFDPGEKLKPYFGEFDKAPAFSIARQAAHKHGLSQEQFAGFLADTYGPLAEQGILARPFDPMAEVKSFAEATGLDIKATQAALMESESFAKGLAGQLKGIPEAMKADVEATLISLTDTAVGNVVLRALSGRLAENGIRIAGEGGGAGELTEADLRKLDADPRIDPRNREHPDQARRYDPDLRKRYDDAYQRIDAAKRK